MFPLHSSPPSAADPHTLDDGSSTPIPTGGMEVLLHIVQMKPWILDHRSGSFTSLLSTIDPNHSPDSRAEN
ncbi:hypothetical protein L1887_24972 [Cichorium endivia]|nr:hypothetical protein L1887_24972 [Cichorium endivia]